MRVLIRLLPWFALAGMESARAHAGEEHGPASALFAWSFEPWVLFCLGLSLLLYLAGALRLWPRMKQGRGQMARRLGCFTAGWLALGVALVTPLDTLGNVLFSAHMVQHEVLMIVAAPLLVLGRPFVTWIWALPPRWRQAIGVGTRSPAIGLPWRFLTHPVSAWAIHAAALWLWHVPALFQAALADDGIHVLQHLSFLLSALLFWWAVLGESEQAPRGASLLYLFTTMMHTGALGALLTVSDNLWYPAYTATAPAFGLSPIEDQQLGGLIMWIPGGLAYLVAGLALCGRWLKRAPTAWTSDART